MKRTGLLLGAAAVTLWSAGAFAQGRNFAGTWTVDTERMAAAGGVERVAAGGGGGGGGARVGGGGGMSAGSGGAVMRTGSGGGGGFGGGRGGSAGGGAVMSAGPMSVTLDAATFAVGSTAYRLDGSVTTMETPRGSVTAKAAWKGDKIVVETTSQGPNGPITSTATWYLEGDSLVRETSTPAPDGGDPRVSKMYYKRS